MRQVGCLAVPRRPLASARVSLAETGRAESRNALSRRVENKATLATLRASEASVCNLPTRHACVFADNREPQPWLATTRPALERPSQTLFGRRIEIAIARG